MVYQQPSSTVTSRVYSLDLEATEETNFSNMADDEVASLGSMPSNHTRLKAHLLCYVPSPLFPAHWSLWIAYAGTSGRGTRIHVTGDALNGFQHDFDPWYDPKTDDRHPKVINLGFIDALSLPPAENVGECLYGIDGDSLRTCTALELLSWAVPAPGPSLRSSDSAAVYFPCSAQASLTWNANN